MEGLAIDRIREPRQRLEDVFMKMVEQAREKKVATSGAGEGGATASFLTQEDRDQNLIEKLVSEEVMADRSHTVETPQKVPDEKVRDEVLETLSAPEPEPSMPVGDAPEAPEDVDQGMIEGLLSPDKGEQETGRS